MALDKPRDMQITEEFGEGKKAILCSCGRKFMLNPSTMLNAVYTKHGDIVGHCPTCGYDQRQDLVSKIPPKRYGKVYAVYHTRSSDRKSIEELRSVIGLGRYHDFTSWAAKVICRIPDGLKVSRIEVVDCSREEYEETKRKVTLRELSEELSASSLLASLIELTIYNESEEGE